MLTLMLCLAFEQDNVNKEEFEKVKQQLQETQKNVLELQEKLKGKEAAAGQGVAGLIGVVSLVAASKMSLRAVAGLGIALSNAWGLMLLVFLNGPLRLAGRPRCCALP